MTSAAKRILMVAAAPAQLLDLAGPAEVFAQAGRLRSGSEPVSVDARGTTDNLYEVELVILPESPAPAGSNTSAGVSLVAQASLHAVLADRRPIDTLLVGGGIGARVRVGEPALVAAVRTLSARARRTVSICTGAFLLAEAGLLAGRRATTHWRWCDALARRHPDVRVEPDPIYISDGPIWTSAGITAGIDLALALVEEDHGYDLAVAIARELVMFLRRPGGQSQFSISLAGQTMAPRSMREFLGWLVENLHRRLSVADMASRAGMSERQFARVFVQELGTTPAAMLERLRVEAARRRLEENPQGLAGVAAACGFGSEEAMRRAFGRQIQTSPGTYRSRFKRHTATNQAQQRL